jgi:hypothetical protein
VQTYVFVKDGTYLSPADGRLIALRRVRVPDLDLLAEENARAGLRIRRNETLSAQHRTNSAFVYETPELRFGSVLVPILEPDVAIRVQDSTKEPPAADKLYHYLRAFLVDVFTVAAGVPPSEGGVLRLEGGFRYGLDREKNEAPLDVTLPICMTPQTRVTTAPPVPVPPATSQAPVPIATLARSLAEAVLHWFAERGLTGHAGELVLRLTLYTAQQDEQLPVLQLNDISLDMELVWNAAMAAAR